MDCNEFWQQKFKEFFPREFAQITSLQNCPYYENIPWYDKLFIRFKLSRLGEVRNGLKIEDIPYAINYILSDANSIISQKLNQKVTINIIRELITSKPYYVIELYKNRNKDLLMFAINNNIYSIANTLLEHGATVTVDHLVFPVSGNDVKMVNVVLKYIKNPNELTSFNWTLLMFSVWARSTDVLLELLKYKPDLEQTSVKGLFPLHFACSQTPGGPYRQKQIIKILLDYGANINVTDKEGITPIYCAASNGFTEIVKELVKYNANVNIANVNYETPLYIAVKNGKTEVVDILLQNGADQSIETVNGETPMSIALSQNLKDIIELLQVYARPKLA